MRIALRRVWARTPFLAGTESGLLRPAANASFAAPHTALSQASDQTWAAVTTIILLKHLLDRAANDLILLSSGTLRFTLVSVIAAFRDASSSA
jgi:hypothetical protein